MGGVRVDISDGSRLFETILILAYPSPFTNKLKLELLRTGGREENKDKVSLSDGYATL